jgi:hypothetical protein
MRESDRTRDKQDRTDHTVDGVLSAVFRLIFFLRSNPGQDRMDRDHFYAKGTDRLDNFPMYGTTVYNTEYMYHQGQKILFI